jgi:hypothetical protein
MPNNKAASLVAVFLLIATGLTSSSVQAGTITGVGAILGTGLGSVTVPPFFTLSEGNDDQPGGPGFDGNIIVPIKRFDNTGFIDIEFFVRSSDPSGTTEYQFFESVDNNTFVDWDSYTLQLGFGLGDGFVPGPAADGLDFDFDTLVTLPRTRSFSAAAFTPPARKSISYASTCPTGSKRLLYDNSRVPCPSQPRWRWRRWDAWAWRVGDFVVAAGGNFRRTWRAHKTTKEASIPERKPPCSLRCESARARN